MHQQGEGMSREERAVLAAWERVQAQERRGSEKRRREFARASRKTQVLPTMMLSPHIAHVLAEAGPIGARHAHDAGFRFAAQKLVVGRVLFLLLFRCRPARRRMRPGFISCADDFWS
jgi:hypothetical protein